MSKKSANKDAEISEPSSSDPIFIAEQEHLSKTYAKLLELRNHTIKELARIAEKAAQDKKMLAEDFTVNLDTIHDKLETFANAAAINNIIKLSEMQNSVQAERLSAAELLLYKPYFAKIVVELKSDNSVKELYIGTVGIVDENRKRMVVDWRSPVAEVYYSQIMGPTSYEAAGRTISVDLKLRRQFDINKDQLIAYFDSDIAIQDDLLLASLTHVRTDKMKAITETIQREQNVIVRHEDVPALLVSGVAGSGKTSAMMQRIAYLFYQQRETLDPSQVVLISPNPVFCKYVDQVLPDLGEENPEILTWPVFMAKFMKEVPEEFAKNNMAFALEVAHDTGEFSPSASYEILQKIDSAIQAFEFNPEDFKNINCKGSRLISAKEVLRASKKFANYPAGPRRATLMNEELEERLEINLDRIAASENTFDEIMRLSQAKQISLFGQPFDPWDEAEARGFAKIYVRDKYAKGVQALARFDWLNVDNLANRLLGDICLNPIEWLYLKIGVSGLGDSNVKYVMVDEVQDYTEAQLAVLKRYYPRAHFMLLGDPNQAITPGTASWGSIARIFSSKDMPVSNEHLSISYRSTPAIIELFASVLPEQEGMQISSVQRDAQAPEIIEVEDLAMYKSELLKTIEKAYDASGLTVIIAEDNQQAEELSGLLAKRAILLHETDSLPSEGVVILPLNLAKGLEFDSVIIPDASAQIFPETPLARRRLYTSLSRATRNLFVISKGPLTPLLT